MRHHHTLTETPTTLDPEPWLCASAASTRCATPGCKKRRGYGLFATMCSPHAKRLAAIREELLDEMTVHGRYKQRRDQRKATSWMGSTCTVVGCENPRDCTEEVCEAHLLAEAA